MERTALLGRLSWRLGEVVDTLAETGAVNPSVSESLQRCAERAANARMARAGATTRVA